MMRLCLLTYDAPHLKTQAVFQKLRARRGVSVDFLVMPFVSRPGRSVLFEHRPQQFEGRTPEQLAAQSASRILAYDQWPAAINEYDWFLVCGSNLIEPAFANSGKIVNCHSGLIPMVRGLDSFKWAILKGQPVGNTLHVLDEGVDLGRVFGHSVTPVHGRDDLASLARRHYERELDMLGRFDEFLDGKTRLNLEMGEPTRRMSSNDEQRMIDAFPAYRDRFAGWAAG